MTASAAVYRILGFLYAGLSLVGSLLLLFNRKNLATIENAHQLVLLFALLWLIFNFTLLYGLFVSDVTYVRIYLHYVRVVFWLLVVALLLLGLMILALLVGVIDQVDIPGSNRLELEASAVKLVGIVYVMCCLVLYGIYSIILWILEGFIRETKLNAEGQLSRNFVY